MLNDTDTYQTIAAPTKEILFKEKKSKFFGYAYPITTEEEVKPIVEILQKKHRTANHLCYAWQLGTENIRYRANDDGEPNNSAGMPIYGQIRATKITNVLVVVARIFGGTKLGTGGLISAYRNTAQLALKEATIIEQVLRNKYEASFHYKNLNSIMRLIKQNQLTIHSQQLEMNCKIEFSVRKKECKKIEALLKNIPEVSVQKISF